MANLATTYRDLGRWNDAKETYVQVIEKMKRVLGEEHPNTLDSTIHLALTYWNQGLNSEAIIMMDKCAQLHKEILGPHHPETTMLLEVLEKWQLEEGDIE